MKPIFKLTLIFVVISLIFLLSYIVFQEKYDTMYSFDACLQWFSRIRPYAWSIGIVLLVADLFMPIPASGVIAALGAVYGLLPGACFGFLGTVGTGFLGYGMARILGPKATRFIISDLEKQRFKTFFDQWGGYAIIISRALPLLPEVLSVLAGISGMKLSRFSLALVAGAAPVSFLFSWIGQYSDQSPEFGLLIAILIPVLLWPVFVNSLKL